MENKEDRELLFYAGKLLNGTASYEQGELIVKMFKETKYYKEEGTLRFRFENYIWSLREIPRVK